jgi:DNA polymerase-3 subunit gamma/tau
MFENVLGQGAVTQLAGDIRTDHLAPSMLFRGPAAAGKGTAALELGRVLSCEQDAAWNCPCSACARHRLLYHPDLLVLGSRPFSPEIAAASAVYGKDPSVSAARFFFIRSVRKLLLRFSPTLWEDDPKIGKLSPLIEALEADMDELTARGESNDRLESGGAGDAPDASIAWAEKLGASILKNAFKLEAEGVADLIPVAHIRRAAWWSRMAPQGRRKLILIENADRMKDEARNALLKILEEPPERVVIVLTSAHSEALLPTILSRLRPYRFYPRDEVTEQELIRKVFRGEPGAIAGKGRAGSLITAYLDSFLPVSAEQLYPLAAFFAASLAYQGALVLRNRGGLPASALPEELVALGKYAASVAEKAGLGRPAKDAGTCLQTILAGTGRFEAPGLFSQFLTLLLTIISESLRAEASDGTGIAVRPPAGLSIIWRDLAAEAASAVGVYNQNAALVLDRMGTEFKRKILALYRYVMP